MNDPTLKPVIFLAFAQDREENVGYLRNLPKELAGISEALKEAEDVCEIVEKSNVTIKQIFDTFQDKKYRERIAVFHYGGHAGSYQLLLETLEGKHALAHSEGLVSFLAKQKGLQLVFLNGCSSQKQALKLKEAGIPAVIGTSQKISDEVATALSLRFYRGLAQGPPTTRPGKRLLTRSGLRKAAIPIATSMVKRWKQWRSVFPGIFTTAREQKK